ncbi:MAG: NAD(P)-dependent oxidoreductase [Acidobacteria bacterium]|nr:NAD(P)-dependent oxidoreductase [Acidobacteriota bacterium]MCI0717643.1 NAD(P)-dependent oxidoreductase [Acidobacteriota bacterium]
MEKILITGVSGFLGWNLACRLKDQYRIYGTCLDHQVSIPGVETFAFDLSDWAKIARLCETVDPTAIVHTAAYSNPDFCEIHHKEALTLNTFGTRELAKCANRLGSKLIYTSTDFVFDGKRGDYGEADDPAPISYYGKTKFLGELEITNHCSYYVTLRIGTLYGRGSGIRPNFFEKLEQEALLGKKLPCIVDQYRTFLCVEDAVQAISQFIAGKALKGLFHLGGPDRASRFEFAEKLCAAIGAPAGLVERVRLSDVASAAPRPPDCSLNSNKIKKALELKLSSITEALDRLCGATPRWAP